MPFFYSTWLNFDPEAYCPERSLQQTEHVREIFYFEDTQNSVLDVQVYVLKFIGFLDHLTQGLQKVRTQEIFVDVKWF